MTPELIDLARKLLCRRRWRWMAGMKVKRFNNARVVDRWRIPDGCDLLAYHDPQFRRDGWIPDLTDPATIGCLLVLARDAWGCDEYRRLTVEPAGAGWCVVVRNGAHRPPSKALPAWSPDPVISAWPANYSTAWAANEFATEVEALCAAIMEAP